LRSLTSARVEYSVWIDIYRAGGGTADRQADLGRLEAQAALFREYQLAAMPGRVCSTERPTGAAHR
jgi:hypothetical protein